MSNKPIQYKKGFVEFFKLKFKVTPDVLIPRPETELLVDAVLKAIHTINHKPIIILDIGTGAGNIAISIAKNTPEIQIIATDISKAALQVAKTNAKFHKVSQRIKFVEGGL